MVDQPIEDQPIVARRDINLNAIIDQLNVGVRRATCFVTLGSQPIQGEFPLHALMGPRSHLQIFPAPPSAEEQALIQSEYIAWITGSALKELDTYLHLYLDGVWLGLQYAARGPVVPLDFMPERIDRETNSAVKWRRVLETLGDQNPDVSHYRNLSNARNVLTHQAGLVTPEKAHHDGMLKVSWMAFRTRFVGDDGTEYQWDEDTGAVLAEVPTRLQSVFEENERFFAVGERVVLTAFEVAQICLFIQLSGGELFNRMVEKLREAGFQEGPPAQDVGVLPEG
jgi:hypothetical protein